ncbi:hypothetical protein IEO21_02920 [Rhodonia placenta]|uniref:Carotenoid oxygenase n=1 Tax=Rhodonia placenta TaxID=104341 RepID=A0A8H7P6S9_9APHY|nr:hypothetical protein IEO21_02920 [Postia placenta]
MSPAFAATFENAPEVRDPIDLEIHGTIPPWVSGVLYRTGPGTYRVPTTADPSRTVDIHHWFDGIAMHHAFEIHPGGTRVTYRSRKGAEDLEQVMADTGLYPRTSFGQLPEPCEGVFRKFFTTYQGINGVRDPLANVSVTLSPNMPGWDVEKYDLKADGTSSRPRYIVAKSDSVYLQLLDPVTLDPVANARYEDLDERLQGPLSAAHGCRDQETGDFYNFVGKLGGQYPTYTIFKIGTADGKAVILAQVKDAPAAYIHSITMTGRYVVFCVWGSHLKQCLDPKTEAKFYVVDRENGGIVARYKTPTFFCFHHLNAFDDPETGDIVVDMAIYESANILQNLYLDKLRDLNAQNHMAVGYARRFRLPSPTSAPSPDIARDAIVEFTTPQSQSIELPVVAPASYHKPYRYAYGITNQDPTVHHTFADGLIKLDMAAPAGAGSKAWRVPQRTPSEPIFVPRPGGTDEDDGVLLSVTLDETTMRSSMVVIDAKEMTEIARAEMPHVYPVGFHGVWYGAGQRPSGL